MATAPRDRVQSIAWFKHFRFVARWSKGTRRRPSVIGRHSESTDYVGQASRRYLLFVIAPRGRHVSSYQHIIAEALEFWLLQRDSRFIATHTGSADTRLVTCR